MNEREIERAAAKLGVGAGVDVQRVARRVVAELRRDATPVAWWRRPATLRAAAAVVLLATVVVLAENIVREPATAAGEVTFPVGLEELSTAGLTEVLDSLDMFVPVSEYAPVSLHDIDESALNELLAAMEG